MEKTPRSTEDRRAINVQLAKVTDGQSQLLQASQVAWSAMSAGMICPIPKLTVGYGQAPQPSGTSMHVVLLPTSGRRNSIALGSSPGLGSLDS